MSVNKLVALGFAALVLARGIIAGEAVNFDDGAMEPLTAINGAWVVEKGKLLEMSDGEDAKGRPFFATWRQKQKDQLVLFADFEVFDGLGEILLCPSWRDRDNYVAAVWKDRNEIRLFQVREGKETILARKILKGVKPPLRMGAAISGSGLRMYVNGALVLEAAAFFRPSGICALGGRSRKIAFDNVEVRVADIWATDKANLCPIIIEAGAGRGAFYRMEKGATLALTLRNLANETLPAVNLTMTLTGFMQVNKTLTAVPANGSVAFACSVPAGRLRPGAYEVRIHGEIPGFKAADTRHPFSIIKRPNPERFPVMMWGGIPVQGAAKLREMGFTHVFAAGVDYKYIWDNPDAAFALRNDAAVAKWTRKIEAAMQAGLEVGINLGPGHGASSIPELYAKVRRRQRDGSAYKRSTICPNLPAVQDFCRRIGELVMKTYGRHPAFKFALINSEVRDASHPCFHPEDIAKYKADTGREIPVEVPTPFGKHGLSYKKLKDFPADRIVADDHPLLTYYRWYWKRGDGWVQLNDLIHQTIQAQASPGFFVWHDPAVRVAPVYGSGGNLDMIGTWTYTYPDPIRVGMTADQLLNMARGRQKVFQMIQMIWYRSQTAPRKKRLTVDKTASADPWDDHDPDAAYITPSPAHMREAFWTAISRPVAMIGYHGLGSLLPGQSGGYIHTHPDTSVTMAETHARVITPFGPMLRKIGDRPADVAFLESFASQVFAQRCAWGWAGGEIGAYWRASWLAGLQADMIYEETVVERGLDKYKILLMPACEVLPQTVLVKVLAFQKRGGIVIGDENLVPGITPDVLIPAVKARRGQAAKERSAVMAMAAKMRQGLAGKYEFFAFSENPEVVLRVREDDNVQYVFAINDKKEFGDYVGRYGLVMDNGVPAETTITVRRTGVKVLDLVAGKEVAAEAGNGVTKFRVRLEPGGGKIFVITNRLPAQLTLSAPPRAARNTTVNFDITVLDAAGNPLPSVLPIEFDIRDPAYRRAEPSGFYRVERGRKRITFDLAENERPGMWKITVTERLTGLSRTVYLRVEAGGAK